MFHVVLHMPIYCRSTDAILGDRSVVVESHLTYGWAIVRAVRLAAGQGDGEDMHYTVEVRDAAGRLQRYLPPPPPRAARPEDSPGHPDYCPF